MNITPDPAAEQPSEPSTRFEQEHIRRHSSFEEMTRILRRGYYWPHQGGGPWRVDSQITQLQERRSDGQAQLMRAELTAEDGYRVELVFDVGAPRLRVIDDSWGLHGVTLIYRDGVQSYRPPYRVRRGRDGASVRRQDPGDLDPVLADARLLDSLAANGRREQDGAADFLWEREVWDWVIRVGEEISVPEMHEAGRRVPAVAGRLARVRHVQLGNGSVLRLDVVAESGAHAVRLVPGRPKP